MARFILLLIAVVGRVSASTNLYGYMKLVDVDASVNLHSGWGGGAAADTSEDTTKDCAAASADGKDEKFADQEILKEVCSFYGNCSSVGPNGCLRMWSTSVDDISYIKISSCLPTAKSSKHEYVECFDTFKPVDEDSDCGSGHYDDFLQNCNDYEGQCTGVRWSIKKNYGCLLFAGSGTPHRRAYKIMGELI